MTLLTVPVNEGWLAASGLTRTEAELELRLILAAKLYELGRITLGQAAEMAGLTQWSFMDSLPRLGVSIVNSTAEQLRDDLA